MHTTQYGASTMSEQRDGSAAHRKSMATATLSRPDVRLLTLNEVCEKTAIGRSTIYRLIDEGRGPQTIKLGGAIRVHPDALDEWIEKSTQG